MEDIIVTISNLPKISVTVTQENQINVVIEAVVQSPATESIPDIGFYYELAKQ